MSYRRPARRRPLAAIGLTLLALGTGCSTGGDEVTPVDPVGAVESGADAGSSVVSLTFTQAQAVPDFDGGPFTVTDPGQLERFQQVLLDAGRDASAFEDEDELCPPGTRSSTIRYTLEDGSEHELRLTGCDGGQAAEDLSSLLTTWRDTAPAG